jgi:hypothetical protein
MDLSEITFEHFQDLIGQDFTLENSNVVFTLLDTKALNTRENAIRTAFSLLFACPVPAIQGTYALLHKTLGRLEIFLVPVAKDGTGVQLEAIFS